ncbi:unnamed protein product [Ilex paraguariensis]|uniref:Uncharacterized protein n=1 Tax=Ilex paraguariensis TaxID=185542 RepID=A0ABC8RTD6_9AQUA
MNVQRSSKDDLKRDLSKSRREYPLGREKQDMDSLAPEVKSSTLVEGLSRGKSEGERDLKIFQSTIEKIRLTIFVICQTLTFYKYQNGEKQDTADSVVEAKEDSESDSELDNFQVSSDEEEAQYDSEDDAELKTSEVDQKAGEFIAKFREQIKLQKTASMERYPDW